jgi:hypothetical protein
MVSEDQGDAPLHHIIQRIWQTDAQSLLRIGEGVYGRCYGVIFGCSPYRAVIKVYKYPGIADRE